MTKCLPEVVKTRQDMLKMMPPGVGQYVAELGVWAGDWAAEMLAAFQPKELHLYDLWPEGYIECGDQHGKNVRSRHGTDLYIEVLTRFGNDDRVWPHRGPTSMLRAERRGKFDFIYVDADHEESAVYRDLENAEWVIAKNGIIAGHDYGPMFPGVVRAVDRFVKTRPWKLWMVTEDGCPSFALRRKRT